MDPLPESKELQARLDDVTGALESLVTLLDGEDRMGWLLQRVSEHAVEAIPGAVMASVSLVRDTVMETIACTNDEMHGLDADQYQAGEGPCMEAIATGHVVRVNAETARRWPTFAAKAGLAPEDSYLSAPLVIDNEHHGALNLYGGRHDFAELEETLLEMYNTAVEAVLRSFQQTRAAQKLAEQLREALTSRAAIDQAKGILMATYGINADDAFQMLVEHSQRDNVKLRVLAEQFVTRASAR